MGKKVIVRRGKGEMYEKIQCSTRSISARFMAKRGQNMTLPRDGDGERARKQTKKVFFVGISFIHSDLLSRFRPFRYF